MTVDYATLFAALAPETIVTVTAFLVLTLDLTRMRRATLADRAKFAGMVSILGLIAAIVPLWLQRHQDAMSLLGGTLVVDPLAAGFKIVIVGLTIVTALISIDYDIGRHVGEYFATMLFGAVGMMLLISAEELVMIFVALELTSICLYILTAFHKGALRSQEAAVKYFMFGAISSAFLLFGLSYIYGLTGLTNLRAMSHAGGTLLATSPLYTTGLFLVIVGFGFKVAMVPFHLWAPDAYEGAPTPVTAYIATGSKVASFFVLTKLMLLGFAGLEGSAHWGRFTSGWTMVLGVGAAASMVLGNCAAIVQKNLKRLLAYSSIAHAGYILVGLVAATKMGAASVLFYVIVYGLTNIGAFGVVAALSSRAGGDDVASFTGMSKRAPFLSLLMMIFMLSLAGVPPLGGFFGKFYLFAAAVQQDSQNFGLLWLVALGILMSAVSLYYYLIVLKYIYVEKSADTSRIVTPKYLNFGLGLVALAVIFLGMFPERVLHALTRLVTGQSLGL